MRKVTFLSQAQRHKLNMWLCANADRLKTTGPTLEQAAQQASADLGFYVNENHVVSSREAVDIKWKVSSSSCKPRSKPKKKGSLINVLANEMMYIRSFLQEQGFVLSPVPDDFKKLLDSSKE